MSNIVEKVRLVYVEAEENSNKYWCGELFSNGDVKTSWGRIRDMANLQSKLFPSAGKTFLDKKKREKLGKGYTELKTVETDAVQTKTVNNSDLSAIARQQIKVASPALSSLIDRLVRSNIHKITSSTQITYNAQTGLFSTPLGIVTSEAIGDARSLLADIKRNLNSEAALKPLVSRYLRLIPHDIGHRFDVRALFSDDTSVQKENDILDSLESSYQALHTAPKTATNGTTKQVEQVFNVTLDKLDPNHPEFIRVQKWYEASKKAMHGYHNIKIVNFFVVDIEEMTKNYDSKVGNDTEVWHGTSEANLLSILKSGLRVSPPSTAYIAGKLFGNGVYGSTSSSKSLGYTLGRWGGSTAQSGWMFVCSFAMGKPYYPKSYGINSIPSGHDSCWALPNLTGLHNDELIVYRNNQVKIKYLLEVK